MDLYGTPRRLSVLGPEALERTLPDLADLYRDSEFRARLAVAAGTTALEPVPHSVERYVANRMDARGDVHGGHVDDYPVAATVLLRSSHSTDQAGWIVDELGECRPISLSPGDCYVLPASTLWHGVGPVELGGRLAVTFAYGLKGHRVVVTESAQQIYGGNVDVTDVE